MLPFVAWFHNPRTREPKDLTQGLNRLPAPVPLQTSLSPSDFHFLLFSISYPSIPSLVVTPVSCILGLLCSVLVPFIVPSDLAHVLCSSQTIKDPVSCMFPQFEYRIHLCIVLSLDLSEPCLTLSLLLPLSLTLGLVSLHLSLHYPTQVPEDPSSISHT